MPIRRFNKHLFRNGTRKLDDEDDDFPEYIPDHSEEQESVDQKMDTT